MKKSLFGDTGRFYKANLHTHTTCSDGDLTPEETKKAYKAQGYEAVAFTDHDVIIPHPELRDDTFLPITGTEYYVNEDQPVGMLRKTYHLVLLAPSQNCTDYPWPDPDYVFEEARPYIQPYYKGNCIRTYNTECVNNIIADAHRKGFLVCYCHPGWSLQTYEDYRDIENADFVEVFNTNCVNEGYHSDFGDHVYQDFLTLGKRPAPAGSDDMHRFIDLAGSATYVYADSLDYDSIFSGLKEKKCYASNGPQIGDITFDPENRMLEVSSSAAKEIILASNVRFRGRAVHESGMTVSHAAFDLSPLFETAEKVQAPEKYFVRIVVRDGGGYMAVSGGYFLDELMKL